MAKFVHLHVHSHYSLLDGLPKIPDLLAAAAKQNATALALTDHGAMYGAVEFYREAQRLGIKPIIGVEIYLVNNLGDRNGAGGYFHLILLAKNETGYKNLLELVTFGFLEGFYYKPRIDKSTLRKHASGIIALSACLKGEVASLLRENRVNEARAALEGYQEIFGKENFYLEIQRNVNDPVQKEVNTKLVKLARETNTPLVATADVHYINLEDKAAQDILVCVGTGKTVNDTNRLDMRTADLHLRTPEEMEKDFADLPEAVANTAKIADQIDFKLSLDTLHFPKFPIPEGETSGSYLRRLCFRGLKEKYKVPGETPDEIRSALPPVIAARIEYELEIIEKKNYSAYFLIVADFVNWSRSRGIITTTRGSAAGSLVAYALGITTINPVDYKLPFERFLNPYRPSPPDIDIDIADNRRDEVLQYVSEKYGKNKVAQIVTFGTMMARAAVRDVGRALGIPYSKCDRIAKMIPFGKQGFHITINKALEVSPDLKSAYEKDPETRNLIQLAKKVEGCARHASVHAAGVVIAPTALTDFIPLQKDTDDKNIITQYEMHSAEAVGLVKMDFLGIRNLSILGDAIDIVRATKGVEINLQKIPLDDKKTYDLLSAGRTLGAFQLGGSGMTKYLMELKPTNIFDIMAMISLYRPGPMESIPEFIRRKHNPRTISYLDPRMKEILDMSYGVITYQDDVLLIAIHLAGYSWEEADKLRKAMGKKILKEMAAQKEKFIQGAITGGLPSEKAVKLWSLIEPFAAYGFNKAHAASYAFVAYETAYMKANYPVEFMAAMMTAESHDNVKVAAGVAECANLGIEVLPPDVNDSRSNFTVLDDGHIRFGLSAVKNLGSDVIEAIITERKKNGLFNSLTDFLKRIHTRNFNKKSWEALVKSGSLDRFGERGQLLANTDQVLSYARDHQKQQLAGQSSLFHGNDSFQEDLTLQDAPPAEEPEKLSWEKEYLGLFVSSHPLKNKKTVLETYCTPISEITADKEGSFVTLGGIVTRVQNILTKKGEPMCFADIEDLSGQLELVVFTGVYSESRELLQNDQIILVRGRVSDKDGEIKILADSICSVENPDLDNWSKQRRGETKDNYRSVSEPAKLKVKIPPQASPDIFFHLKNIFENHRGSVPVSLLIPDREGKEREIQTEFLVQNSTQFKNQLKEALKNSLRPK